VPEKNAYECMYKKSCVYSHVTNVQFNTDFSFSAGYVCERKDLLVNGCCNVNAPSSSQHVCKSCLANGCCSIYEYCVSCCLQPDKQPLLERFLNRAAEGFQNLFTAVEDHFELCLAKCRTSSQSVQHENTYRNPQAKYCYGESPPELLPI
uniref:SREBP regulating gene protein n=1 Tax=Cyprinus carpio TaxID=7962 RepID=A0A8C1P545_CYPCA